MYFKSILAVVGCCTFLFVGAVVGKTNNSITITCENGYATKNRHHAWELKEISGSPCIYVTVGNGSFKQVSHIVDIGKDKFSVYVDGEDFLVTFQLYNLGEVMREGKPVTGYVLDKEYVAHHFPTITLYIPAGEVSRAFRKAIDSVKEQSGQLVVK